MQKGIWIQKYCVELKKRSFNERSGNGYKKPKKWVCTNMQIGKNWTLKYV